MTQPVAIAIKAFVKRTIQMTTEHFPSALKLQDKVLLPIRLGCSGDQIWQVFAPGAETPLAYLKQATDPYRVTQLRQERDVLHWLKESLSAQTEHKWQVPQILGYLESESATYLLSSALNGPGAHEAISASQRPAQLKQMAAALSALHQMPVADCPFDTRLETKLKQAKANWLAGRVDQSDLDDERLGTPISALYQRLLDQRPTETKLVFTHGDACLPNLILTDPPGWIDWSRAGLADPWQDLALFCRSLKHNGYQQTEIEAALQAYGVRFDPAAYDYYTLLDEFF